MAGISTSVTPGPSGSGVIVPNSKGPRLSFASVAALAASQRPEIASSYTRADNVDSSTREGPDIAFDADESTQNGAAEVLRESVARLNIIEQSGPIIASAGSDADEQTPVSDRVRYDDEKTHLSFISNPTVSTDVRSVISGTTFGMDEKESIRPDESASVKAAEEDESSSGGTSGGPQSLAGSEAGKAFRDQFHEISGAKKALPLTANLVQQMPDESGRNAFSAAALAYVLPAPDEKLLEALQSQRDRMFLLQLEQQFIDFVKNPKEQTLLLPPNNAFCRLLAHRLADYYSLTHTAESNSTVRIGKTENSRQPPPLNEVANSQITTPQIVQPPPALKIMRRSDKMSERNQGAAMNTDSSSALASSEAGSQNFEIGPTGEVASSKEVSPVKDSKRPTLEEREAIYNARREQLYKEVPEKKSGENSAAASRASSILGGLKPKKKIPKNDDFEPRSAYMSMNYANSQQQGYGFSNRSTQQAFPYPQAAPLMNQETPNQNYMQPGVGQQGYHTTESTKVHGGAYGQPTMNYGYGMHQAAGGNLPYIGPVPSFQPVQPYGSSHYDGTYAGYATTHGQPQMMQPSSTYPSQQLYMQSLQQGGQFAPLAQGQYMYPIPVGSSGMASMPVNNSMFMPTGENNNTYSNPSYQMYTSNASSQIPHGMINPEMTTTNPHLGSSSTIPRSRSPGHGYFASGTANVTQWHSGNKGQGRERVNQVSQNGQQNKGSGQLNKYDKSSLPPKPPAPAQTNQSS